MAMSSGYIPFHPNPSKPHSSRRRARSMRIATCSARRRSFPTRRSANTRPCDAPKEKLVRAARFSRLRQERDRAGELPRQGQLARWSMRSMTSNDQARGVAFVGEEVTDARARRRWTGPACAACASISSGAWSISRRATCSKRIAARIAPLGWHIVVYFEMPDLPDLEPFFTALPTTVVVDHMGGPDGRRRASITRSSGASCNMLDKHHEHLEQGDLPGAPDRSPGRPMTMSCRSRRTLVERFPDRVLWGTDWPHPNMPKEAPDDGVLVDVHPEDRADRRRCSRRCWSTIRCGCIGRPDDVL